MIIFSNERSFFHYLGGGVQQQIRQRTSCDFPGGMIFFVLSLFEDILLTKSGKNNKKGQKRSKKSKIMIFFVVGPPPTPLSSTYPKYGSTELSDDNRDIIQLASYQYQSVINLSLLIVKPFFREFFKIYSDWDNSSEGRKKHCGKELKLSETESERRILGRDQHLSM